MEELLAETTSDRGYAKNRTGRFVSGAYVLFGDETYYGGRVESGTEGVIVSVTNAGFRGIEAFVKIEGDASEEGEWEQGIAPVRYVSVNLDALVLAECF